MKKRVISAAATCAMLVACKTKDHGVSPETRPVYFPLTVGSQWIYDTYQLVDDKYEVRPGYRDTVTITGDTTVDQKKYVIFDHSLKEVFPDHSLYRDSSGYLLGPYGRYDFFSPNIDEKDTISRYVEPLDVMIKFVMKNVDQKITVPAGTFEVIASEGNYYVDNKPAMPRRRTYYAKNVGLIYEDLEDLNFPNLNSKKVLVSYHVK